jgi:hypothetical protein
MVEVSDTATFDAATIADASAARLWVERSVQIGLVVSLNGSAAMQLHASPVSTRALRTVSRSAGDFSFAHG